ncbi:MAG: hypothetical protein ACON44_01920 [Candidatus Puniceispirillaceae bacterium]
MFLLVILSIGLVIYAFASTGKSRTSHGFDVYFFIRIFLAILCAIWPIRDFLHERKLGIAVEAFLGKEQVIVDCKPYFDFTLFTNIKGYVFMGSDKIYLEARTCSDLAAYIRDPEGAGFNERFALHVLTHEAMHVAGTSNEIKTDCQAYQRNHRMSVLLDVPRHIAITHARQIHRERSPYNEGYYSPECEPGKSLDENLPDAVWLAKGERPPAVKREKVAKGASISKDIMAKVKDMAEEPAAMAMGLLSKIVAKGKAVLDSL